MRKPSKITTIDVKFTVEAECTDFSWINSENAK